MANALQRDADPRAELERLRRENLALVSEVERLRGMTGLDADGDFETDARLRIVAASAGFADCLGLRRATLDGADLVKLLTGGLADTGTAASIATDLEEHRALRHRRLDWRGPDGPDSVIRLSANPMYDENGGFAGFRGVARRMAGIAEVERNHRRLIGLMENTPDLVAIMNADLTVRYANPAGRDLIGLKPTTRLENLDAHAFYPEEIRDFIFNTAIPEAERVGVWRGETEMQRLDGTRAPISQVILVGRDASGRVDYYGTIARDISEAKLAEAEIRDRDLRFGTLVEGLIQGILVVGRDWTARFANSAFLDMFKADGLQALRDLDSAMDFVAPEDREGMRAELSRLMRGRARARQTECDALRLDGTRFRCYALANLIRWEGEPALLFSAIDISPLARAQEDLRQSEERYALAVRGANDGLWDWDLSRNHVYTSPRCAEIVGHPEQSGTHHPMRWLHRICPDDRAAVRVALLRHLRGEAENFSVEFRTIGEDGAPRWLLCKGVAVRSAAGELTRMAGSVADLAAIKQAEDSLRVAKDEAEIANRAKTEFLANISHELRSPLNAIIGFADIIEREQLGPLGQTDYIEFANNIGASARSLLSVINDILDMSRLETGAYNLVEEDLSLDQVASAAVDAARADAEPMEIAVTMAIGPDLPGVYADRRAIRQIMRKLLSNAIKFSPRGGAVDVRVGPTPDGGVLLRIRDHGIGIAPDKIESVMIPFRQASGTLSRSHEGVGLGLSIAKALTELHGGQLILESAENRGTSANVFLPPERCSRRAAE